MSGPFIHWVFKCSAHCLSNDLGECQCSLDLPPVSRTKIMEVSPQILENFGCEDHTIYR